MVILADTMDVSDEDQQLGEESEDENSEMSDGALQEAFAKGLLKPGMNITVDEPKKFVNNQEALKMVLADFSRDLPWVERLDLVNLPADDIIAKAEGKLNNESSGEINPDDDFQREMFFYRQAQASVLEALPRLKKLKIFTKRPDDYFAEMAKTDQHMQKIRKKLISKQAILEKSAKAKKLREQRKYGKKVQVEVIQRRQKEKKAMMTSVKKYQKGMSDKLDFLEGDQKAPKGAGNAKGSTPTSKNPVNKKGPNSKRKHRDQKFGYGGKKSGTKWNTKESYNDVSQFSAKAAHGKGGKGGRQGAKGGKQKPNKRPGKNMRKKMKGKGRS